jgi:hypothetical protein
MIHLPNYLQNKPELIQRKWSAIHDAISAKEGPIAGTIVANQWLKRQKVELVKRSILSFKVQVENNELLKRSESDEDYVTFILAGTQSHYDGVQYDANTLQSLADQINERGIVGDIDHLEFDRLRNSGFSDEEVQNLLLSKRGIAKGIRALVKDGQLYVRAITDKRYSALIRKSKGVSLEAMVTKDDQTNKVSSAKLLGFTFNVNTQPADPSASVLA